MATTDVYAHRVSAFSFLNEPTLLSVISGNKLLYGITVLGGQLFAIQSVPHVYNTTTFNLTRIIPISGSKHLSAIVASPRYNCFYASDFGLELVHRYDLTNNVVTKWSVGGNSYGISITRSYHLLVTVYTSNQLKEYTQDGNLVRVINLDRSMERPWNAVELSNDQFVVSHDTPLHRVCIVNASGRIIRSYGGYAGSSIGMLNKPRGLAVDVNGNVLVADSLNGRVVVLSPSLQHLGDITIPGYQLMEPMGLHFNDLQRRLYVGEHSYTGRVFVLTSG